MSEKRQDYISWDEYFMGVAKLAGLRSKDPNSQVGSCIVSPDNKILFYWVQWFSERVLRWCFPMEQRGRWTGYQVFLCDTQRIECYSELSRGKPGGSKIYVSLFPCNECSKADHPERNPWDNLWFGQIRRYTGSYCVKKNAGCGRVHIRRYIRSGRELKITV